MVNRVNIEAHHGGILVIGGKYIADFRNLYSVVVFHLLPMYGWHDFVWLHGLLDTDKEVRANACVVQDFSEAVADVVVPVPSRGSGVVRGRTATERS